MELLGISLGRGPYEEITETLRVLQTKKAWEPLTGTTEMEGVGAIVGLCGGKARTDCSLSSPCRQWVECIFEGQRSDTGSWLGGCRVDPVRSGDHLILAKEMKRRT